MWIKRKTGQKKLEKRWLMKISNLVNRNNGKGKLADEEEIVWFKRKITKKR